MSLFFGQTVAWLLSRPRAFESPDDATLIFSMGNHLKELLMETKHRGAFEQVYCGFSQVCAALCKCPAPELNRLPATWLREILADLQCPQAAARLCLTRRSAGLPFMLQAILSPEIQSGRAHLFTEAVTLILSVAAGGGASTAAEGRIHALNILRFLFRDSRFAQAMAPYVGRGVQISVDGFEAGDCGFQRGDEVVARVGRRCGGGAFAAGAHGVTSQRA